MSIKTEQIDVKGMYCSNCANRIEKVVGKIDGVSEIHVNLATEIGQVTFHQHKTDIANIISRINQIGFEASPHQRMEKKSRLHEVRMLRRNFMISAVLTIPLAWGMLSHINLFDFMYVPSILVHPLFQFFIAFPIQFIIGFTFYDRAWKAIKNWSLNMDVLVVLSTTAAFLYSHYITFTLPQLTNPPEQVVLFYETSAFIITFILLGRYLEAKTKLKTTEALERLYEVQMKVATVFKNNQEIVTKIDHLVPGDILLIKPGERIPIDGQVIEGHSLVDESLLTGESMPIEKKIGSEIYAGTINHHGVLMMKVMKKESETILSNIIKIVEDAQISKAPIQQIADKITGFFIPIVLLIAGTTFIAWFYYVEPGYFGGALVKMIAVLIVACPCALGLATPTSMMVGSGRAAQVGVLFKEGKFMELLGKCDTILLDKTGTITSGTPRVTNIYVDQMETKEFMEKIGAVERVSEHPIAKAILKETKKIVPTLPMVTSSESIPSYGIKAVIDEEEVVIANASYYKKNRIKLPMKVMKLETSLKNKVKQSSLYTLEHALLVLSQLLMK